MDERGYAQSQGMTLLSHVVEQAGPLFTVEEARATAAALVSPVAISHWSAPGHHGFTTQIPPMVQASTTASVVTPEMRQGAAYRPRGRAARRALLKGFHLLYALYPGKRVSLARSVSGVREWPRDAKLDTSTLGFPIGLQVTGLQRLLERTEKYGEF